MPSSATDSIHTLNLLYAAMRAVAMQGVSQLPKNLKKKKKCMNEKGKTTIKSHILAVTEVLQKQDDLTGTSATSNALFSWGSIFWASVILPSFMRHSW